MTKWGALAGMISGAATVIIWTQFKFLKDFLYEMIPGFAISLLAIVIVSLLTQPSKEVEEQFEDFENNIVIYKISAVIVTAEIFTVRQSSYQI